MKFKTKLVHAVVLGALGVATSAQAVNLGEDGLGQVLLYPYYTAQNGNSTLITLVNTTDQGKAVKVRVRESLNSREVIDFHLYLSPKDAWSAAITADAGGGAKLKTYDKSCTVPQLPTVNADGSREVALRNLAYSGVNADGGPTDLARTMEGYIEVIEMGEIVDAYDLDNGAGVIPFGPAVQHVAGVPGNCAAVNAAWLPGGSFPNVPGSVTAGTGGLFGSGSIINVTTGTDYSFDPVAIENFNDTATLHNAPSDLAPTLGDVSVGGGAPSNVFYANSVYSADWDPTAATRPIDAVSAVLMRRQVMNEYTVNAGIGAGTDFVITFPTKWAYTFTVASGTPVIPPFTQNFAYTAAVKGACEPVVMDIVGREEEKLGGAIDFSPKPTAAGNALCWEANVVTMSNSNVLGSANALNVNAPFADGWMTFTFNNNGVAAPGAHVLTAVAGGANNNPAVNGVAALADHNYRGLPVIGFGVQKYVNGSVGGVLSNYGGAFAHKYVRVIN